MNCFSCCLHITSSAIENLTDPSNEKHFILTMVLIDQSLSLEIRDLVSTVLQKEASVISLQFCSL